MRLGIVSVLRRHADFEVVGEASDGNSAVAEYKRLKPDVLLLDLGLPDIDGWQVLKRIFETDSAAKIAVFSAFSGDEDIHRCLKAGAKGFLLKEHAEVDELVSAVRGVATGRTCLSRAAADTIAGHLSFKSLTRRELQVLQCMAHGQSNKEIGWQMGITESTVKGFVASLMLKLGVRDRTHAVTIGLQRGFIKLPKT